MLASKTWGQKIPILFLSWNEACTPGQCCFCQSGLCLQQAWLLSEIQKHCPWLEQYRCIVNLLKNMPHLPMYQGSQSGSDWNHPRHRWCWYYLGSQCLDLNTRIENVKKDEGSKTSPTAGQGVELIKWPGVLHVVVIPILKMRYIIYFYSTTALLAVYLDHSFGLSQHLFTQWWWEVSILRFKGEARKWR